MENESLSFCGHYRCLIRTHFRVGVKRSVGSLLIQICIKYSSFKETLLTKLNLITSNLLLSPDCQYGCRKLNSIKVNIFGDSITTTGKMV